MPRTAKNYQFERRDIYTVLGNLSTPQANFFRKSFIHPEAPFSLAFKSYRVKVFLNVLLRWPSLPRSRPFSLACTPAAFPTFSVMLCCACHSLVQPAFRIL